MTTKMRKDLKEFLLEGAGVLGVALTEEKVKAFGFLLHELMKWNRKMNLTSIKDPFEIVVKHFLDSLAVSPHLPPGSSLLDVGSGAGFPCIVLKIYDQSLKVTSIDSSRKKISFQRHLIRQLRLEGIDAVHAHLPDPGVVGKCNKSFDYAISRASGNLESFLRIARPYIKDTGIIIAMKGKMGVKEALNNITVTRLNMRLQRAVSFTLPFIDVNRTLLFFAGKES
ncbi:MAG: 16S rRNA (guanine(527)-N(7))-methyltransferase RsmG [Syntrophobacterales bacterium]|nr:MAG: 16S rRNA (guanine(527)-N(7))-methyltransferase RsmG [Syntrophobacterales bacterium]